VSLNLLLDLSLAAAYGGEINPNQGSVAHDGHDTCLRLTPKRPIWLKKGGCAMWIRGTIWYLKLFTALVEGRAWLLPAARTSL
jgi:hypothetical protein